VFLNWEVNSRSIMQFIVCVICMLIVYKAAEVGNTVVLWGSVGWVAWLGCDFLDSPRFYSLCSSDLAGGFHRWERH